MQRYGETAVRNQYTLKKNRTSTMSKIERLNARVAKLLTVAVHEVLEVVRETVSEYQEKTARTQRENESLRRRLQELQDKTKRANIDAQLAALPVMRGSKKKERKPKELCGMSKIERLNARVAKLLTVAVHEVLEVVRETVSEYQEKTARTQRENESLRRRLQELQDKTKLKNTGNEQSAILSISEERVPPGQEWNPNLRQDMELILAEQKQEMNTVGHRIRQREEEGSGLESDHILHFSSCDK
ncbi:hypothetical protein COCON_G00031590 [Conger conger]|uniref:Uncharacterized protein n=1 Tax=Conger conger TaxID=82655 RepID=A0A9Q1I6D4_CONCO|nr:hypothetical protein COCON_G00031590 [Conger conger]